MKLVHWNFQVEHLTWVHFFVGLVTTLTYMALGAIGAYFLVDHDARGQKMLKNAFLMGFVAPSFFLALLNNPATARAPSFQRMIDGVPKISQFFVGNAYAQEPPRNEAVFQKLYGANIKFLEKKDVEPSFGVALKNAFGWGAYPSTYAYVVGTTEDEKKAGATAASINKLLQAKAGTKLNAFVVKPKGYSDFYVAVGGIGSPDTATMYADFSKQIGMDLLPKTDTEDGKKAAALLLGGQIVDARAMFHGSPEK